MRQCFRWELQNGKANSWFWADSDSWQGQRWGSFSHFPFFFLKSGVKGSLSLTPIRSLREGLGISLACDNKVEVRPGGKELFL